MNHHYFNQQEESYASDQAYLESLASDFLQGQRDCVAGIHQPNMSQDYYDGYAQQYAADECAANGYPQ